METDFFSYYFILKSIIAISLLIIVLRNLRFYFLNRKVRSLANWSVAFWIGVCGYGLIRVILGATEHCSLNFDMSEVEIFTMLDILCNAVFLSSMIMFLREFSDFEKIMYLFAIAGIVTSVDFVFLYKLDLVKSISHVIQGTNIGGRYRGIIQNDYVSMGRFCVMSIGASMYLWTVKRRNTWLILALGIAYILFHTYQRTAMSMALIIFVFALTCWVRLNTNRRNMFLHGSIATLVIMGLIIITAIFPPTHIYIDARGEALADPRGLYARIFLLINGIQLFTNHFVMGVGPGESQYCLVELLKNLNLSNHIFSYDIAYFQMTHVVKGIHNMYLTMMVEFGLIGTVVLGWWLFLFIKLWLIMKKESIKRNLPAEIKVGIVISFGILLANAFGYLFDNHYYWFIFMLTTFLPFLVYRNFKRSESEI